MIESRSREDNEGIHSIRPSARTTLFGIVKRLATNPRFMHLRLRLGLSKVPYLTSIPERSLKHIFKVCIKVPRGYLRLILQVIPERCRGRGLEDFHTYDLCFPPQGSILS